MGLDPTYTSGQTPLEEEEKDGLLIKTIGSRYELDEFEQQNIEDAIKWSLRVSLSAEEILSEGFIKKLHEKMFGNVWAWAGEFRKTNKNLGVDRWRISTDLKQLLDDTNFWIKNSTYHSDEIAIRFKHRLVSIHCFTNGNGRHSRLMADIIINKILGCNVFSWGVANESQNSNVRHTYLSCLREADGGNIAPLVCFART